MAQLPRVLELEPQWLVVVALEHGDEQGQRQEVARPQLEQLDKIVGREGFSWSGATQISAKREWPDWTPPAQMLHRRPDLPRHMAGGIDNPLGARAMYLGSSLYRIHGSNEPDSIGQATSSGCIRLTNEDVIDLYSRVRIGTPVIVQ